MGVVFSVVVLFMFVHRYRFFSKEFKTRGVKVETLWLPAVTDFSEGMYMYIQFF